MLILVKGKDADIIDKAVAKIVAKEESNGKKLVIFNSIIDYDNLFDSVVVLSNQDVDRRWTATNKTKLLTYMIMQSRMRANVFVAPVYDMERIELRIRRNAECIATAYKKRIRIRDIRMRTSIVMEY